MKVYLIGDSTMCDYSEEVFPRAGWGQYLKDYFKSGIKFYNKAVSGCSSKSFWDRGFFKSFSNDIEVDDYLFIQFGHNDEKDYDLSRYTIPETTFKEYLKKFIGVCENRLAKIVLITPVERRAFDENNNLKKTHGKYSEAILSLASENNIPCIDLTSLSRQLYIKLGVKETKKLFLYLKPGESPNYTEGIEDDTHFQVYGAKVISKIITDELKKKNILTKYIKY